MPSILSMLMGPNGDSPLRFKPYLLLVLYWVFSSSRRLLVTVGLLISCLTVSVSNWHNIVISQDKISEAWDSFRSVRDERDGDTEASMQQEFNLLHAQILHEEKEAVSFMDLLTHPNLRRRCIIGFLTLFAAQGTGTLVINSKFSLGT